jgi:hypothetical protein
MPDQLRADGREAWIALSDAEAKSEAREEIPRFLGG